MPTTINKKQLIQSARLHWYHWLIVFSSLVLTLCAWYITSNQVQQKNKIQFDFHAGHTIELVKERMNKYEEALWAGVASLHSQSLYVDKYRWKKFAQALSIEEKYPGINGIGIINHVEKSKLNEYLKNERKDRPAYNIHPIHQHHVYWPITHIEPLSTNAKAVGLDMAHEINRRTAAEKARNSGLPQITGPIILVQDAKKTPGFLFFAPFYSTIFTPKTDSKRIEKFRGIVYAPFIMEKLMKGTLKNENRMVNFKITDQQTLLYTELNIDSEDYDATPLFSQQTSLKMYGRIWSFEIQSSKIFKHQQTNNQPLMILIGGILIDSMLLGLFLVLANYNKKAVALAEEMTHEYHDSEARLGITVNSMKDALFTYDQSNIILSFNQSAEIIFNCQAKDVIGKNTDLILGKNNNEIKEIILNFPLNKTPDLNDTHTELTLTKNNLMTVPIDLIINKASSSLGTHYIAVIRDLSVKKHTEQALAEKEALLNTAFHASSAGFAIINSQGYFIESNQALYNWLGFRKEELIELTLFQLMPKDDPTHYQTEINELIKGKTSSLHVERQYQHKNGHLLWGLLSAATVTDDFGKVSYAIIHITDIQKEKELLSSIIKKNVDLEKSNADLEQFAYIASHDLKAPLNAIHQLSTWIEEDCSELLPDASRDHLSLLQGRSKRMVRLLEDLLSYSRVSRYDYTGEIINLQALVRDQFELLGVTDGFSYVTDDVQLFAPRVPFELVIRNLLSNAIKHHDNDVGVISVTCTQENGFNRICVTDDGPGIHPDMHDKALEMFQTLRPRDEVEGSGMGLAMVKRIVSHYQGKIEVESDGKRGTSIVIRWPQTA